MNTNSLAADPAARPNTGTVTQLDAIHHVAIVVQDVAESVQWYRDTFRCEIAYQDETWALLKFANASLALVVPNQHPMHIGFVTPMAHQFAPLKRHRDGTESVYISDPTGNAVELLSPESVPAGY
jgi:catechol-2,3-dioxygenase